MGAFIISRLSSMPEDEPDLCYKKYYDEFCLDSIVGTIGQHSSGSLQATPGISLSVTGDGLGQKYRTPENAWADGADLFIIGRDIYANSQGKSSKEMVQEYKKRCWELVMQEKHHDDK